MVSSGGTLLRDGGVETAAGGGQVGTGGATGGTTSTGGKIGTGGVSVPVGGSSITGGSVPEAYGGFAGMAGMAGAAGLAETGGTAATGGTVGIGGTMATGGTVDTGGVMSTGGATGTGGVVGATTIAVSDGMGIGLFTGAGWVSMGLDDTVTTPTCGGIVLTSSTAASCPDLTWSTEDSLCVAGSLPSLGSMSDPTDYLGVEVGVAAVSGTSVGQAFKTVAFYLTSSAEVWRAGVHLKGDSADTTYCYGDIRFNPPVLTTSGQDLPLASFFEGCSGTSSTGASFPSGREHDIDSVFLQVYPQAGGKSFSACLSKVVFVP